MSSKQFRAALLASGAAVALLAAPVSSALADSPLQKQQLQRELNELQERLERLEARKNREAAKRRVAPAAAVEAGSRPRTWKLPGTNTSMQIGGYVYFQLTYDINGSAGDQFSGDGNSGSLPRTGAASGNQQGNFRLQARRSRFFIRTWTPTDWGTLATRIEGDFRGTGGTETASNSNALRLRQAYGQLGPVLAGQTTSTFRLTQLAGETLEGRGPAGDFAARQAQIRYTHSFGGGWSMMASVENPETVEIVEAVSLGGVVAGTTSGGAGNDPLPEFVLRLNKRWSTGYAAIAGLIGRSNVNDGVAFSGSDLKWGIVGGAAVQLFNKRTRIGFHAFFGYGIGRFFDGFGPNVVLTGTNASNTDIRSVRSYGGVIWWQQRWTKTIRTNLHFGRHETDIENEISKANIPGGTTDFQWTIHANIVWQPIRQARFGFEYIHLRSQLHNSSADPSVHRLQLVMRYDF